MAVAERVEQLRESDLFSDLDEDALARIAADTTEYDCPADTVLIEAGVPGIRRLHRHRRQRRGRDP